MCLSLNWASLLAVCPKNKITSIFASYLFCPIYKSEGEDKGDFYELCDGFHASMGSFLSILAKSNY